jgi:hypothetical protein
MNRTYTLTAEVLDTTVAVKTVALLPMRLPMSTLVASWNTLVASWKKLSQSTRRTMSHPMTARLKSVTTRRPSRQWLFMFNVEFATQYVIMYRQHLPAVISIGENPIQ